MARGARAWGLLLVALVVAGCAGTGGGATVSNQPGHFSLSAGGATSGSTTYDWQNPSASARVSWSVGGTGSMTVTIADSSGHQVFSETLNGAGGSNGGRQTSTGTPGAWKITVASNGAGGANLNVDAA